MKPETGDQKGKDEMSLPARGAWVETLTLEDKKPSLMVAPRKGSVG